MKDTELHKLANNVLERIHYHFSKPNGEFIIPEDMPFMNEFLKEVRTLCKLSRASGKWIMVSEELPELNQVVLVKMDFGEGYYYDIGRYDCNDKMFYSEAFVSDSMWNSLDDVIEWKPID